jgi:hypothetical protein
MAHRWSPGVDDSRVRITGTDTYELLAGGFFLIHHVDVLVGDKPVRAIEIICDYDAASGLFTARAYDNDGSVTAMRAHPRSPGMWTFTGGADVASAAQPDNAAAGGAVQSTLTVGPHGKKMKALWERSDDGASWRPWMDMTFTRIT